MFGRQIWEADDAGTLIHRISGRVKLAVLAMLGICVVLIDSPRTLFLLLMVILSGHIVARSSLDRWALLLTFLLFSIWGSMVSQAVFYNQEPRTPLICLLPTSVPILGRLTDGIYIYQEGLMYGATQALRVCSMLAYGFLVCWTTDSRELLRGFLFWRLPYRLAFMAVTGLRFLPVIAGETFTVLTAQRMRGFRPLRTASPPDIIRTAFRTLWPVLARSLRRAVTLAMSVESRGFAAERAVKLPALSTGERLAVAGCLLTASLCAGAKLIFLLQYNGFQGYLRFRQALVVR